MNHIDYTQIQRRAQLERARYMRNLFKAGFNQTTVNPLLLSGGYKVS